MTPTKTADIVDQAFKTAITHQKAGDDQCWKAFEIAADLGWDCEDYPDFMRRVNFMSDMEILVEGRKLAAAFFKAAA